MSNIIKKYADTIVSSFVAKSNALKEMTHKFTKGQYRELFIANVLKAYLPFYLDIGTGIIVNQKGCQSSQNDIVIYDKRVLPPFIHEQNLGVYPAESVLSIIEVKSSSNRKGLYEIDNVAGKLFTNIYSNTGSIYKELRYFMPIYNVLIYNPIGLKKMANETFGENWLNSKIQNILSICSPANWSWIKVKGEWRLELNKKSNYSETKRFISILIDNLRRQAEYRWRLINTEESMVIPVAHKDYLGQYIRD